MNLLIFYKQMHTYICVHIAARCFRIWSLSFYLFISYYTYKCNHESNANVIVAIFKGNYCPLQAPT